MQKLSECLNYFSSIDSQKIFMFTPSLGNWEISPINDETNSLRLKIPYENGNISITLDEDKTRKYSILLGIGNKHFDILIKHKEKLIDSLNELTNVCDEDFYFLVNPNGNLVSDVAINTEPVSALEIMQTIREWYKQGSYDKNNQSIPWTDETLDENLLVYYLSNSDDTICVAFGIKETNYGGMLKFNRLGSIKTTINPCWMYNIGNTYIPVVFDIKGIMETKPFFKKDLDLMTNISTILGESEDFLYNNTDKLSFSLAMEINPEQYIKHLAIETKIPKKYVKKQIISGFTIKNIVNSICSECFNILKENKSGSLDDKEIKKNLSVFNKLIRAAGYATFYQNRFCNCCYKTTTITEEDI